MIIKILSQTIMLCLFQVCAEAGGGVVSVRDFVNLRHWASVGGGVLVSAGGSVEHPAMPPVKGKVRGENGPTCWALRPVQGRPDTCLFQWLLDTDLKVIIGVRARHLSHTKVLLNCQLQSSTSNFSLYCT